ncbi:HesA/MoeB/ThiF family protein [Pseudoruegeria sp. SK021]|uniref:HesA/MoeB/ThiF family protein n=1 Tax=Pseudoruegeria sp. SK021 TaxID=1933035 RepID=UPI00197D30CC|nr:HesA/MoeB/ThiF family protein [Pseudoruegeria sp. SK021]
MSRYARQECLPEFGPDGQAALGRAHVLVVGAGGLGCPALQYLAGAGVGTITVVDGDVVSLSNLHRQTLYREDEVGQSKAEAACRHLRRLNSDCELIAVPQPLTPLMAAALVASATLVLDCADSFAVSYTLSDACVQAGVPMISASALGRQGYVGGFCGTAPSLRAVFPDLPSRAATCATAGVMGPVVGMIGAMQAQLALSHLLGFQPAPLGQLVTVDMIQFRTGGFRFDGVDEPETPLGFIGVTEIAPTDFVVDLRGLNEAPVPATPGALRSSVEDFEPQGPRPEPGQRAVMVCRSGLRSWQAARRLQSYWPGTIALVAMGESAPDPNGRMPA